ncbi:MAG TPA: VOC family protein [Cyclobacteriaceae bacterium]|nr:VOC family protein [Cyclobacteriaceae bacterium]
MASKISIAPWLTVTNGKQALEFYKSAFGAIAVYQLDTPDESVVARLSIDGAEFWISDGDENVGSAIRMILTTDDPDRLFSRAIKSGATEIFPVSESHGWRVGRLADPFGFHWEIGKQLDA